MGKPDPPPQPATLPLRSRETEAQAPAVPGKDAPALRAGVYHCGALTGLILRGAEHLGLSWVVGTPIPSEQDGIALGGMGAVGLGIPMGLGNVGLGLVMG